jgi:two-component system, response regulator
MTDCGYVLLVEDSPDEVFLAQRSFKKVEVTNPLRVVTDGRQALDFVFSQGSYADRDANDKPELILLDLKLPLVNGLDVLKEIKANPNTSLIPVVVLTSSTEDRDQTESYRLGADDFICKPTSLIEFVEIVKKSKLNGWLVSKLITAINK